MQDSQAGSRSRSGPESIGRGAGVASGRAAAPPRRWLSPPVRLRMSVVHFEQRPVHEARLAVRSSEDPIRVVYCIDNMQVGGTELNAVRTAERLDRRRFSISVVCIRDNGPLMARYQAAGIPVHTFPMPSLLGVEAIRQAVRLVRLLRRERVEVVHSHDAYTSVYGTICARIAGVRGIIASRRSWYSPHLRGRILQANRVAYRFAHRVVGNSPSVSRLVESGGWRFGIADRDDSELPRTRGLRSDRGDRSPEDARRARRAEHAFVVGIVARLSPVKDHGTLLHAIASLRDRIPALHCVLIGDGPERNHLEALADSLGDPRAGALRRRAHATAEPARTVRRLRSLLDVGGVSQFGARGDGRLSARGGDGRRWDTGCDTPRHDGPAGASERSFASRRRDPASLFRARAPYEARDGGVRAPRGPATVPTR